MRQNGEKKPAATLTVEQWPVDRVIPYARNPRKNEAAVAKVAASLREFGFRQPLVVDRERVLVVGHTRLMAARQLGMAMVPVHVAADLTPAQAKAYRLADNRTAEEAEWMPDLLALEFEDLKGLDFDLSLTGFDPTQITDTLGTIGTVEPSSAFGSLPNGDKPPFEQMTFTLHTEQADVVREALEAAKAAGPFTDTKNENSNGNALARLAEFALGVLR